MKRFFHLIVPKKKVVTLKKSKNTCMQAQGTSEHITMLCAASAAGLPLPLMITFPRMQYRFNEPDDTLYARSESGCIDSELFLKWMRKTFLKHVVIQWPVLLFTDGHKSHVSLDVIDLCRKNEIILFVYPHIQIILYNPWMLLF